MITYLDLSKSNLKPLPYLSDEEYQMKFDKGWSYSFVYHFTEIRNIFILINKYGFNDLKSFTEICLKNKLPFEKTQWNERRILEHVNALKNFGLITEEAKIKPNFGFDSTDLYLSLSISDLQVFHNIYFSYFRFREMMTWFINPDRDDFKEMAENISEESVVFHSDAIYTYSIESRFTDALIYDLKPNTTVYSFKKGNKGSEDVMRFWDVFIKWAMALNLIEKFNLTNLDIHLAGNKKPITCLYFKKPIDEEFDLLDFIGKHYKSSYINVPKLIFRIATQFRYSIDEIKNMIIKTSKDNPGKLSLQRTSEIFIRNTEINFVPKVNDSYISHILLS